MRAKRLLMPGLVCFLSLGFFSQSPVEQATVRRISSFECVDCAKDPVTGVSLPSVLPLMANANVLQSQNSFNLFSNQLDFQARVGANNLSLINGFNRFAMRLPTYPSYVLPSVANYQVSFVKPASSNQIFGGLAADPALKHLIQPGVDARTNPSVATGLAPTPLNVAAVLEANLGLAPSPNVAAPVTAPASPAVAPATVTAPVKPAATAPAKPDTVTSATPGGETIIPKSQDRVPSAYKVSSLLGSRPVNEPIAPQVSTFRGK